MHYNPFQSPASAEFQPPNPRWRLPWLTLVFTMALCLTAGCNGPTTTIDTSKLNQLNPGVYRNVTILCHGNSFECKSLEVVKSVYNSTILSINDQYSFEDGQTLRNVIDFLGGSQADFDDLYDLLKTQRRDPEISHAYRIINHKTGQVEVDLSSGLKYYSILLHFQ